MIDPDHALRAVLFVEALVALMLSGVFFGHIYPERGWPIRIICAGLFVVLVYVFAGQVKAFNLGIPFDWFSAIGLVGYVILDVGLAWFALRKDR